ncbi:MAG: MraY family glycosyltransferase [Bacteroidota bacterium]
MDYLYLSYAFSFVLAFAINLYQMPLFIKLGYKFDLTDNPGGRKIHKKITPLVGGIGIVSTIFPSILAIGISQIFFPENKSLFIGLMAAILIFAMGVYDDKHPIKAKWKLLISVFPILMAAYTGLRIENLYGLFGIHELPIFGQYAITVVFMLLITNAWNLIDGINGFTGSLSFFAFAYYGFIFSSAGKVSYAVFCFLVAGACGAFLPFNWRKAKTFMGDAGSLCLGFMIGVLSLSLFTSSASIPVFLTQNEPPYLLMLVISQIWLPVVDTVQVFSRRIAKGISPFKPDNNHVHHMALKVFKTHEKSTIFLTGVYLFGLGCTLVSFAFELSPAYIIGGQILLPITFLGYLYYKNGIRIGRKGIMLKDKISL